MDQSAQADLLRICRRRLGMSVRELQVELCFKNPRTVRRMEAGEAEILGPTWIALMYILDERGEEDLADRIQEIVSARQKLLDEERAEKWRQWEDIKRSRTGSLESFLNRETKNS